MLIQEISDVVTLVCAYGSVVLQLPTEPLIHQSTPQLKEGQAA